MSDPELRGQIAGLFDVKSGVYGRDFTDAIKYIKQKLELNCSNGSVRRAVCSLIHKGVISRAVLNPMKGTLDAASGDTRVILYKAGATEFPSEFLDWVEESRRQLSAV